MAACTARSQALSSSNDVKSGNTTSEATIAGRYRTISAHQLCMAWWAHVNGHITRRQLRVFFAAHEMAERRRYTRDAERPLYRTREIQALVGEGDRPSAPQAATRQQRAISADVKQLARLGLVRIDPHSIWFASTIDDLDLAPSATDTFLEMLAEIGSPNRKIPVPRRMVRALAGGFSRGVTACILAMLVRSLFWQPRTKSYRTDTRTKGSWIAEVFGISRRAVTDARQRLIDLGWLKPLETPQNHLNRWGTHDRINLDWRLTPTVVVGVGEAGPDGTGSASPVAEFDTGSASPYRNRTPSLTERSLNTRRPAPTGAGTPGDSRKKIRKSAASVQLHNLDPAFLKDSDSLKELYQQAVTKGLARSSEAGEHDFLCLVERARARGQDPCRLFTWLLKNQRWDYISQADEDAALERVHAARAVTPKPTSEVANLAERWGRAPTPQPASDLDRHFIQTCIRAARECRVEPWKVAEQMKGWTKQQWDEQHLAFEYESMRTSHSKLTCGV